LRVRDRERVRLIERQREMKREREKARDIMQCDVNRANTLCKRHGYVYSVV